MASAGAYRRNAFISYSHRQDVPLAAALQGGLHRLARPWTRRQTINVFRDTTSLGAGSDLGAAILQELGSSEYFIYIASPAAAQSRWVREEIGFWTANRSMDRFLIAVSDGTIAWDAENNDWAWDRTDCLPEVLRGAFRKEPLWVDLTAVRQAGLYSLRDAPFRDAVATLLAPLRGQTKDQVDSEDLRQRRTAVRMLRAAVATLSVLLALSLVAGVLAWQQRGEALARARTSASQALAARALESAQSDPRKAAQFALYAYAVQPTGESAQALGRAVAANDKVEKHFQQGNEHQDDWHGKSNYAPTEVAISRDGSTLAYYSDFDMDLTSLESPRHIHLYDIRAGKAMPTIEGVSWPLAGGALALSTDGRLLAVERVPNEFELWDVPGHKRLRSLTAGDYRDLAEAYKGLRSFALAPDGQRVAAAYYVRPAGQEGGEYSFRLTVWETATGSIVSDENAAPDAIDLTFDKDSRLHALDEKAGTVRTLTRDTAAWTAPRNIPNLPGTAERSVRLSSDGTKVYTSSGGDAAGDEVWDLENGRRLAAADDQGSVRAVSDANGPVIAIRGRRSVVTYDPALRNPRVLGTFSFNVFSVSASGDGRWVAAASLDGAVSLFSTSSVRGSTAVSNDQQVKPSDLTEDKRVALRSSAAGTDLWSVRGTGVRRLGHIALELTPTGMVTSSSQAVVSSDGSRAVITQESRLSLWNLREGTEVGSGKDFHEPVKALGFLPDGVHLVATMRNVLHVLDTRSWESSQSMKVESLYDDQAVVSADGKTVAALTAGGVSIWRYTDEHRLAIVRTSRVDKTLVTHLAISSRGERVATVNGDGRLSFVDVATGHTATSTGVSPTVGTGNLVFSDDAGFVVQAVGRGADATLQFWDAYNGEGRGSWPLEDSGSTNPSQADSSARLFTGADGAVLAFTPGGSLVRQPLGVASWRQVLCDLVPEPLPQDEQDRYLKGMDIPTPCSRTPKE
ncbi:WD40 repeat protein [Streptomyces sp. Ag109_G2-6]|uniref:toll/interleukin-1 receptor domain-containing protein n=1 Tax=Streptomyces TaxID=1883 RepID=UPI000FADA282|nr:MULTISPECIES: TIR domain-containing protein [Streptomyces]RPF44972.1 WD40 repeat protein [Streptomyces sp. Ag109_G2-6]